MALSIYLNQDYVGQLSLDEQRRFLFQYDSAWLKSSRAMPLSLSLPLCEELFENDIARPFFTNLLPEAQLRDAIARKLGLSNKNDYALLEAIGGECAGAVTLLPEGQTPKQQGNYQRLSETALCQLIEEMPQRPMLAGEAEMRLSLAGVQNKLPVYCDGRQISLPQGNAASSHILKPAIADYPDSIFNEAYCMRLAAAVGLPTPEVILLNNQSQWLYLIKRYDRQEVEQGKYQRLHQEDFCQALGILPEIKYEKEGGPSLASCVELIRAQSIQPVADMRHILSWVAFNYLISNADAHGKNISLLLTEHGPKLAPFYDLMSTAIYPGLSERPAMKIGGEDRPQWIIERSWQRLAQDCGIGFKLLKQTLDKTAAVLAEQAPIVAKEFQQTEVAIDCINAVQKVIHVRSKKLQKSFNAADL